MRGEEAVEGVVGEGEGEGVAAEREAAGQAALSESDHRGTLVEAHREPAQMTGEEARPACHVERPAGRKPGHQRDEPVHLLRPPRPLPRREAPRTGVPLVVLRRPRLVVGVRGSVTGEGLGWASGDRPTVCRKSDYFGAIRRMRFALNSPTHSAPSGPWARARARASGLRRPRRRPPPDGGRG